MADVHGTLPPTLPASRVHAQITLLMLHEAEPQSRNSRNLPFPCCRTACVHTLQPLAMTISLRPSNVQASNWRACLCQNCCRLKWLAIVLEFQGGCLYTRKMPVRSSWPGHGSHHSEAPRWLIVSCSFIVLEMVSQPNGSQCRGTTDEQGKTTVIPLSETMLGLGLVSSTRGEPPSPPWRHRSQSDL